MGFIFAAHRLPPPDSASSCSESSCVGDLVEGRNLHLKILVGWPETFGAHC